MESEQPKKRGRPRRSKDMNAVAVLPPPKKRNKKGMSWEHDPEILARLSTVANMMVQGAKTFQIAEALSVDIRTIQRDVSRVYTLWRRESMQQIDDARAKSIAQYEEIKTRAWEGWRKSVTLKEKRDWLKLAMEAEAHITDLQGTKITRLDVNGKVEHSVRATDLSDEQLLAIITGKA